MSARDLIISDSRNLPGSREFNHLRIANLDAFFSAYNNSMEYYASPFQILADLETQIKFENKPEDTVLCAYKPDGDVIFDLVNIREEGALRVVEYEFATFIS
jgi:hypothetical protein